MYPLRALSSHGTTVLAAGVFVGLLFPALSDFVRPAMPACIFLFVLGTLLRIDFDRLKRVVKDPVVSLCIPLAIMVGCPAAVGMAAWSLGLDAHLTLALVLASSAPPSSGNAAVARMLGFDGTTALAITLCSMLLCPLTVPVLAALFGGLSIDPLGLAARLAFLIIGAEGVAFLLRSRAAAYVDRCGEDIDGAVVLALFVFAVGTMAGVGRAALSSPSTSFGYVVTAIVVNASSQAVGCSILRRGLAERVNVGITFGNRNIGLVWAALGTDVHPSIALFFALVQFPIYLSPRVLQTLIAMVR